MIDASKSVLLEAHQLVYGQRHEDYGSALENDTRVAGMLRARFGWDVKPTDVWQIMVIVKLSREAAAPKRDNRTDIAGYAEVGDQLHRGAETAPEWYCGFCKETFTGGPLHECHDPDGRKVGVKGGCPQMITISGTDVTPDHGSPSLWDVGYGLAGIRRYAGQTPIAWTVLQHSHACRRFAELCGWPAIVQLHCLVHDAPEAVTGDITYGWKTDDAAADQEVLEGRIHMAVGIVGRSGAIYKPMVKVADYQVLFAETFQVGVKKQQDYIGRWLGLERPDPRANDAVSQTYMWTMGKDQSKLAAEFVDEVERLKKEIGI